MNTDAYRSQAQSSPLSSMPSPPLELGFGRSMYGSQIEKTFVDKVLAKEDLEKINEIKAKKDPSKEDLNQLVALVCGMEIKLLNFDRNDQYINGKYYIWVEEIHKIVNDVYDYYESKYANLDDYEKKQIDDVKYLMIQNLKFACGIFHFMTRSTLSHKAAAFDTLTTTRNEQEYIYGTPPSTGEIQKKKRFWIF